MMTEGYPRSRMNRQMRMSSASEGEGDLYYFPFGGLLERRAARDMSANRFVAMLLRGVLHSAQNEENYVDRTAFEATVRQEYIAFVFLCYACNDPAFYSTDLFWKSE